MIGIETVRERLSRFEFPGGNVLVEDYESWIGNDAMQAPTLRDGPLHPIWLLVAGFRGMGITLSDLYEAGSAEPDVAVMFGETKVVQHLPLEAGRAYEVTGEFTGVRRRSGERIGTFDIISFKLEVWHRVSRLDGYCENSFIFPRKVNE